MHTPYGEIFDDDVITLEYRLNWYLRYGNQPTCKRRETDIAKTDYGVQYERYVGHLFEEKGFRVTYNGIRKGKDDGGIDLIARGNRKIRLIQCKRWNMAVNSDVISRLQGGLERFIWNERKGKSEKMQTSIRGVLATSGDVEPDAMALAKHLGIYVMKNLSYRFYPAIKAKEIIPGAGRFLLPFNSEYDRMDFNVGHGDRFFMTIREALSNGFYYPPYHKDILKKIYALRKDGTKKSIS